MSRLIVETSVPEPAPEFAGPSNDLIAFLSFVVAERYGALHPLSAAANVLRKRLRIDLRPLMEFGDAEPEDEEDERSLRRLWQAPRPLAESALAVASALRTDEQLAGLVRDFPAIAD